MSTRYPHDRILLYIDISGPYSGGFIACFALIKKSLFENTRKIYWLNYERVLQVFIEHQKH